MRVLTHKNIEQEFNLDDKYFYNLVIENPKFLREIISGLQDQLDNGTETFIYLNGMDELKLEKEGFLILNPYLIEMDEKKVDLLVQKDISGHQDSTEKDAYQSLLKKIKEYLDNLVYDYDLPLTYNDAPTLAAFLKSFSLSVNSEYESFLEYILVQLKKIHRVFGYSFFFIYNLHDLLTDEELTQLMYEAKKEEITIFLLSSHRPLHLNSNEFIVEIDEDLAELHIEPKAE